MNANRRLKSIAERVRISLRRRGWCDRDGDSLPHVEECPHGAVRLEWTGATDTADGEELIQAVRRAPDGAGWSDVILSASGPCCDCFLPEAPG